MEMTISGWNWRAKNRWLLVEMDNRYILFIDTEPYSGRVYSFDTVILGEKIPLDIRKRMVDTYRKEGKGLFRSYPKKDIRNYYRNKYVEIFGEV